ncbi:MAG: VOC family protein [Candidatus Thorarchaeota archaeon]
MPRVVHFEIVADDAERTIKFYENTFGWKIEKWDGPMDYWLIMTGDPETPGIDGGLGLRQSDEDTTVNTIDVESIDETVKKIEKNGGEIVRPKGAVPGVGWLIYFKDTEGNLWGAMQSDTSAK